ncbi:YjfB family protein [Thiosocius teredinicola]|uniref:YjfB family protein n=1 Tax=Thiosocius teredinicola TaxID=1973002 RepID=UPI000990CF92
MNISSIPSSLLQQINNGATQTGDAVAISVMRKTLDIQASQASQLISAAAQAGPDPSNPVGQNINIKV